MRVIHRIGLRATATQRHTLEELGVKLPAGVALPGGGDPLLAFDVDESHRNWRSLAALFQGWRASDVVRTEFTKREYHAAYWLEIGAWHHGYPQPDEDVFGYRQATYDLTNWCESCGIGKKQKAPFQMKGEPKWGRNAIMQLIWIYDELFVTPDAWRRIFKPAGAVCRPVLNTKGVELKTVVQLVVEETVGIITDGLAFERCARCGWPKHLPVTRGFGPALRDVPTASLVRTAVFFGSGAQADQRLLISQDLARALTAGGVRGAELKPSQSPSPGEHRKVSRHAAAAVRFMRSCQRSIDR